MNRIAPDCLPGREATTIVAERFQRLIHGSGPYPEKEFEEAED
jgi:hypothetical protein